MIGKLSLAQGKWRAAAVLPLLAWSAASFAFSPTLHGLDGLPLHAAPSPTVAAAVAQAEAVKGEGPALFAVTVPLPVGLDAGLWDEPQAGVLRWRTRVYSTGARSLLLAFSQFRIPEGAQLWVYDTQGRVAQGPYTTADQTPDGGLWTAMVPGESAVIELRVPAARQGEVELALGRVGHAYKNADQLGASGACNVDVACAAGDAWRAESRSAVKLQIPVLLGVFVGLCSGSLVNNTAQDGRPFVLTANHCGIGDAGSLPSGVVVYWNFANSACGVADAPDSQTQTGVTLRASDAGTDLTLLELNQMPPAAFDVYYAGWEATLLGSSSGVSIHHPAGDARKISVYQKALVATSAQINTLGPNLPVWRLDHWDLGTTEPGSSGAGLWNRERRIIGVLSGGRAACNGSEPNREPDYFARLNSQWQARPAASGQLKAWLDPIGSGCLAIDGRPPGPAGPARCGDVSDGGGGGGAPGPGLLALLLALRIMRTYLGALRGARNVRLFDAVHAAAQQRRQQQHERT